MKPWFCHMALVENFHLWNASCGKQGMDWDLTIPRNDYSICPLFQMQGGLNASQSHHIGFDGYLGGLPTLLGPFGTYPHQLESLKRPQTPGDIQNGLSLSS